MFKALSRVVGGFLLACLTAGLFTVLFVKTPWQLVSVPSSAFPETIATTGDYVLLTATHFALFAATFALVATGVGEWLGIRSPLYYAVVGTAISLLGFFAQFSSEVAGQPTILNAYALAAYISSGLAAGVVYWAVSGRYAGGSSGSDDAELIAPVARPRIIIEKSPRDEPSKDTDQVPGNDEEPRRSWKLKKMLAERTGLGSSTASATAAARPAVKSAVRPSVPASKPAAAKPARAPDLPPEPSPGPGKYNT